MATFEELLTGLSEEGLSSTDLEATTEGSVNQAFIPIKVVSQTTEYDCGETITSGDIKAYLVEIEFMDVKDIQGICNLHFIRGDGETVDIFGDISGNKVSFILNSGLYAVPALSCYVQFVDSNLYTPLLLTFSGIRMYKEGPPVEDLDPYPEWVQILITLQAAIDRADASAGNAQSIADEMRDLTDLIQYKLDAGELKGDKGDKGDKPNHAWSGYSLRFENVNGTWGNYVNLRGATGKTAFEYATENGWTDTESLFGTHLGNVDKLMYDEVIGAWMKGRTVTQAQYEDLIANSNVDTNTMYFVRLPEGV